MSQATGNKPVDNRFTVFDLALVTFHLSVMVAAGRLSGGASDAVSCCCWSVTSGCPVGSSLTLLKLNDNLSLGANSGKEKIDD